MEEFKGQLRVSSQMVECQLIRGKNNVSCIKLNYTFLTFQGRSGVPGIKGDVGPKGEKGEVVSSMVSNQNLNYIDSFN